MHNKRMVLNRHFSRQRVYHLNVFTYTILLDMILYYIYIQTLWILSLARRIIRVRRARSGYIFGLFVSIVIVDSITQL